MNGRLVEGIRRLASRIERRPVRLMEVCGTHTVAIFRHGLRSVLEDIEFLSGPGCPVCVTPQGDIDRIIAISKMPGVVVATFGDMMRVPGSAGSLYGARAESADVRVVYSVLDALELSRKEVGRRVVFFSAGFETTTPAAAAALLQAEREGLSNFYLYSVSKLVPPALDALLSAPEIKVDGFILPGHVSTIIGTKPYEFMAGKYKKPAVIAGFDAQEILETVLMLVCQIADGRAEVEIQYGKAVRPEGNLKAVAMIEECFERADSHWRGIGTMPASGLKIRERFSRFDAERAFDVQAPDAPEPKGCSCGKVLRGLLAPDRCPLFGKICTPESPVGACMVSTEGSCAAYYRFGGATGGFRL
jgi:hydrogenase expression/formation protein HypD